MYNQYANQHTSPDHTCRQIAFLPKRLRCFQQRERIGSENLVHNTPFPETMLCSSATGIRAVNWEHHIPSAHPPTCQTAQNLDVDLESIPPVNRRRAPPPPPASMEAPFSTIRLHKSGIVDVCAATVVTCQCLSPIFCAECTALLLPSEVRHPSSEASPRCFFNPSNGNSSLQLALLGRSGRTTP